MFNFSYESLIQKIRHVFLSDPLSDYEHEKFSFFGFNN